MFLLEVIPIKRGFGRESLTYFSAASVKEGSLVSIPLRGKVAWGIVASSIPASIQKAELKASTFAVRKIGAGDIGGVFFEEWWMKALQNIAKYFAVSEGAVLGALIPALVLDNIQKLSKQIPKEKNGKKPNKINIKSEVLCIQTEDEERWGYYRSAVREEFAKKHSIFICLPTHEDIRLAVSQFEKGIEKYTFVFHSGMSRTELVEKWGEVLKEEHPVLIIATAQWLNIPRKDIGTIILDRENSSGWKTLSRPYIDMRKVAEFLAKERGVRLILGDSALRVSTIWRYKNDEIFAFEPVKFRLGSPAETILIGMKNKNLPSRENFKAISASLKELLQRTKEENKNLFIYATRKGLSSITVCSDCGEEVVCHNCSAPMVLYKSSGKAGPSRRGQSEADNIFKCHQCNSTRSAKELCKKCSSWRLMPLGVGIERVVDEITEAFPETNVFQISKDATSSVKAIQVAEKFYKTPGSVLVGTEMALYYLKKEIDFTAVASIDSLFSIPDFRIREKIFHLVLSMKLLAREKCLVQIRGAERTTIELALSGNILDFYKMEIEDRELLQYPPFSVFIKITVRGPQAAVAKESQFLEEFFAKWNPVVFASSERRDEAAAANCVMKIAKDSWPASTSDGPNSELLQKILSLPPYFEIKVDPDNLL